MHGVVESSEAEIAFNLAYRILGSERDAAEATRQAIRKVSQAPPDAEHRFGLAFFAATRGACHGLISRQPPPPPAEGMPASGESSEEAIAAAGMRLPIRQREALALRELGPLSYAEIATVMETGDNAVAQLISRARINLSDELRGTVLASIAAPSPACERALPLIAMREDDQLEPGSADAAWLDAHLDSCERCRLAVGAMREAAASYRGWAPIAVPADLIGTTTAAATATEAAPPTGRRRPLRRPALAAGLALLLFLAGLSAALLHGDPAAPPLDPAADAAPPAGAASAGAKARAKGGDRTRRDRTRRRRARAAQASTAAVEPPPLSAPIATEGTSFPSAPRRQSPPPGGEAVEPTQKAPTSKPKPKPAPTTAAAPQPAPEATPTVEEPPPPEEASSKHPKGKEPPGKAVGRQPK